jgi:hypothetical protein
MTEAFYFAQCQTVGCLLIDHCVITSSVLTAELLE